MGLSLLPDCYGWNSRIGPLRLLRCSGAEDHSARVIRGLEERTWFGDDALGDAIALCRRDLASVGKPHSADSPKSRDPEKHVENCAKHYADNEERDRAAAPENDVTDHGADEQRENAPPLGWNSFLAS